MNQEIPISGNIIKSNGQKIAGNLAVKQKVIKNQIVSAQTEAARIVEGAEEFAAEIRREAQTDAEKLKIEAYREGTENALTEFERNLIESREIRERVWRETEKDLLRLSVRLAEKIIGREIKKDDKTIVQIITTALQNARQQEKITVRVNPKDLPTVESETSKYASGGRIQFVDFVADPRVLSSGCMIESQLRVLERALLSQSEGENSQD
jgi:type III secretion protein L